jgi:hypothetical protein
VPVARFQPTGTTSAQGVDGGGGDSDTPIFAATLPVLPLLPAISDEKKYPPVLPPKSLTEIPRASETVNESGPGGLVAFPLLTAGTRNRLQKVSKRRTRLGSGTYAEARRNVTDDESGIDQIQFQRVTGAGTGEQFSLEFQQP